jgi:4-amino-4-deoxy-L-arabinose transferase-like glycosyltransferase
MQSSAEQTPRSPCAGGSSWAADRPIVIAAAAACLGLLALQLALIGRIELTFDEAYYALWSRRLAWGYLDHPPMVAAWIRASTTLFGPSEFGVRALGTLILGAMPALVALTAWRLFGSIRVAALASLMWVAMPLAAGAVIVTPDTPLVVFWTLGMAALVEVWRTGRAVWWLALGLALGLALLSKFTAAFLAAGVALALLTTPSLRRWSTSSAPYATAMIAAAIFAPFLMWNAEHGWATFAKQLGRVPAHGFSPQYLVEFVLSQIGLMNPLVFLAVVAAIGAVFSARARPLDSHDEARRLALASIAPAIVYFALHALHNRVQGNWLAPLYPALAILAADAVARAQGPASGGLWRRLVAAAGRWAAPLGLLAALIVYEQTASGVLSLGKADPTLRIGGWRELTGEVDRLARQRGAAFVVARGYAATSLLTYYGDPALPVVQRDQRQRWLFQDPPPEALFEAPGLAFGEADRDFAAELAPHFAEIEEVARLQRRPNGRPMETYVVYRVAEPIPPVLGGE